VRGQRWTFAMLFSSNLFLYVFLLAAAGYNPFIYFRF
jgi:hypothetical protein